MTEERVYPLIHPVRLLELEFLEPLGISSYHLAKEIGVPSGCISGIVRGEREISADTALRLAQYFGMSERFWVNAQAHYNLEVAKDHLGAELKKIKPRARGMYLCILGGWGKWEELGRRSPDLLVPVGPSAELSSSTTT